MFCQATFCGLRYDANYSRKKKQKQVFTGRKYAEEWFDKTRPICYIHARKNSSRRKLSPAGGGEGGGFDARVPRRVQVCDLNP